MVNQKKSKILITLLIITIIVLSILCVLFATKTISLTNKDNNNNNEWVTYLKSKDINIKTSVWNSEKEECEFNSISITTENIKEIINKLSSSKITKYYYGNNPPVGTVCSDRFQLEYENNKINLEADGYMWIEDDILSNKIDLDVDNTIYEDNYTKENYVYKFDIDFANIFNNYK